MTYCRRYILVFAALLFGAAGGPALGGCAAYDNFIVPENNGVLTGGETTPSGEADLEGPAPGGSADEAVEPPPAASASQVPEASVERPDEACGPVGPARAEDGTEVMTLDECLKIAMTENPGLHGADEAVEGARWSARSAFKDFLPKATMEYMYYRMDDEPTYSTPAGQVITRLPAVITPQTYQAGTLDNYTLTTTISQTLFAGGALVSQYRQARLGLDVAEISRVQARMDLALQLKQTYYGVLQAEKGLDVARQSVKQLEELLKNARSFYDVGMAPKNQVLEAEVRLAEAVQQQTEAEHNLLYAKAALNVLLRRPMDTPVLIEDIMCPRPIVRTMDECLTIALGRRPEILSAEKQIKVGLEQINSAQSGYFPSVAVSYNHTKKGEEWDVSGDEYHEGSEWNVAAVAQWEVFAWGQTRDQVQAARAALNQYKMALLQAKDGVKLDVKQSYLSLQAAAKNITVAKKAVEQAEENYRMSTERYREQVATSTEVTDAETLLTSARTNYYNSLYSFCLAWASLERAMGLSYD